MTAGRTAPKLSQAIVLRGAGSNAFSFIIRFAARAGMLYIGARLYGAAAYGVFSLAVAVVELMVPVASLGLKRMIFPWLEEEAPARGAGHVLLDALLLAVVASAAVTALVVAGAQLLPAAVASDQLRFALAVLAPAVLGQVIGDIALAATRWTNRMRYEVTARGLIEPYAGTAATLAAWHAGMTGTGLLLGYWAGSIALAASALWGARHGLGPLHFARWRPDAAALFARARHLLVATGSDLVTAFSQRVDLYLVGLLLGDAPAGVYGVLRQLRTPITQVRQAFDGIVTPLVARTMRADGDGVAGDATAAATRVILTLQLGVVLFMAAAGEALLGLFGTHYAGAYPALILMALAETVNGAFGVSELILYYRRPALALLVNVVLIAIAGVMIPLLARPLGVLGAAAAMLAAAVVAAQLRRHWLSGLGVRRAPLHAAVPVAAAAIATLGGALLLELLIAMPGEPPAADRFGPPLLALALYGAAVWGWTRQRPGVLSMARFRTA